MAGIKISSLPAVPAAQLTDVFPIDQGLVTYKESNSQLLSLFESNIVITDANFSGTLSPTHGGTGINNGSSTLTLGGPLTTVGAFVSVFNFTGATNVTFPTTGTLATTASSSGIINPGLINQLAYYASAGTTLSGLTDANQAILTTDGSGIPAWTSLAAGQILVGTTAGAPVATAINSGTNILVANGSGSITVNFNGTLPATSGGTGQSTYILGDTLYASAANTLSKLAGNITSGVQYLSQTGTGAVSAAPVWATISGGDISGAALTKGDDTNVTLTLGGTPATALLRAASITAGWTGQLSLARGGTNANLTASNGGIFYSTASAGAILAGTATANQVLLSGSSTTPAWSTATYPATTTVSQLLYSSSANVIAGLITANSGVLVTSATGVPSILAAGTTGQVLQASSAGTPAWSTPTYPAASGSAGTILRSNGTNNVYSTSTFADTYAASALLYSNGANTVTGLATANDGVLVTSNTGVPSWLANSGTPGYVLTANSGAPPSWAAISAAGAVTTINGDSGSATPSAGAVTISGGTTGLTTSGSSATLNLTGTLKLTNGGSNASLVASNGGIVWSNATQMQILSGTATAGQMLQSGASATPAWSTTTYPTTNAINTLLYASSANVMAALATANNGVLTTGTSGIPVITALGTDGQIIIGSSAGAPAAATISAGTGISVTNGHNTISIAISGADKWVDETGSSVTMAANTGYTSDDGATLVTFTLPTTSAIGDWIEINGKGSGGWTIAQATGQLIHIGNQATTSGATGTLSSSNQYDCVRLRCLTANTIWTVTSQISAGLTYI